MAELSKTELIAKDIAVALVSSHEAVTVFRFDSERQNTTFERMVAGCAVTIAEHILEEIGDAE